MFRHPAPLLCGGFARPRVCVPLLDGDRNVIDPLVPGPGVDRRQLLCTDRPQFGFPRGPLVLQIAETFQLAARDRGAGFVYHVQEKTHLTGQHGRPCILVLVGFMERLVDLVIPGGEGLDGRLAGLL